MSEITAEKIKSLVTDAVQTVMLTGVVKVATLPVMYKFPEDIRTILRDKVAESTVRGWKTMGYLQTTKVGSKTYVTPEQWLRFVTTHQEVMKKNNNRRALP